MDGSARQQEDGANWQQVELSCRLICPGCFARFFSLWPYPAACGIFVLCPGTEPTFPALEGRVLTAGLPGKSLFSVFNSSLYTCTRLCEG